MRYIYTSPPFLPLTVKTQMVPENVRNNEEEENGLSEGAIAGIVIVLVLVLFILLAVVVISAVLLKLNKKPKVVEVPEKE